MKLTRLKNQLIISLLASTLCACNIGDLPETDNIYLPDYEGDVALAIAKDTIQLKDFLEELSEDANIEEGEDFKLSIVFRDTSVFEVPEEFIAIEDSKNERFITSPIDAPMITPRDTTLFFDKTFKMYVTARDDEQLDSIYYASGFFDVRVDSDMPGDLNYTIFTESFVERTTQEPVEVNDVVNNSISESIIPLDNYKTYVDAEADTNWYYLDFDGSILIPAGTALTGAESIHLETLIRNAEIEAVFGYFGQDTITIDSQKISLDVFNEFGDGDIAFGSPAIRFEFENSFGVPMGLDFSNVYGSLSGQENILLTGPVTESLQPITKATLSGPEESTIEINQSNSNLPELLNQTPDSIIFEVEGISNPEGNSKNFLYSDDYIKAFSTIEIPLDVKMDRFEYENIFTLEDLSDLEGTQVLTLVFNTINEFPFDGELDLIFLDANGEEMSGAIGNLLFESPNQFDANGKVTEPSVTRHEIVLNEDQINDLINASEVKLINRLNTFGLESNEFVSIYSDYRLFTTISIRGKLSLDLSAE